jgi:hypothetical protein
MTSNGTTPCLPQSEIETSGHLFDNWFDPIEAGLRDRARALMAGLPRQHPARSNRGATNWASRFQR